ncbi:hypothetical protein AC481_05315 [miscellaneous Crenarchaeota group archaeon SMTZ-80]|nr:MAG: hypothetical protein AC481_05315 [miscellaneous Crenarchaeota group archaeon SMTZ-80]
MVIKDNFGRPIYHIRVSITQKCDLNCFYCHKEGQDKATIEMTPKEIYKIIEIASGFDITKVKITGGEPLLRSDLSKIVHLISKIGTIEDISLVTNARNLTYERALKLKNSGLTRININLPSLNEITYRKIVGRKLGPALEGINAAAKAGLYPIKINMVLLKGINDNEVYSIINYTKNYEAILQLIELEPLRISDDTYRKYFIPLENIENKISKEAKKLDIRRAMQNRRVYTLKDGEKVEFVRPVDNTEFCLHCTKIRLTSNGELKPCLMSNDGLVNILNPLRIGEPESKLRSLFLEAIKSRKPYCTEQKLKAISK